MIEIGMDQHKRFSVAAALDPDTRRIEECRLEHDDPERIVAFLTSFDDPVRVTIETTGNWYWLADLVEQTGATVQLCHTLEAKRRRRGKAKNDRLDAIGLAELSAEERVPSAYVPARPDRDRRERHRFRIRLVRLQTALKNTIHSLLSKLNVSSPFSDAFGKAGREYLAGLSLREPYRGHLDRSLALLDAMAGAIATETAAIRKESDSSAQAKLLMSAPGIGELTAHLILYEVGPVERFPTDKQFASYCSLAPGTDESAERRGRPGVGRVGNLYLKEAFCSAALTAIRKDVTLRTFYNRLLRSHGGAQARMATARKLAVGVYHMLKRNKPWRPSASRKTTHVGQARSASWSAVGDRR